MKVAALLLMLSPIESFVPTVGNAREQLSNHKAGTVMQASFAFGASMKEASAAAVLAVAVALISPVSTMAISGGGLDYASSDISKQDFSNGDFHGKDFSGCVANEAKFVGSKLRGARFFKSDLKDADFTSADLTGVSLEQSDLTNTNFRDAVLEAAYFTSSTLDQASSLEGADFTDAIMRDTMQRVLCEREDLK